MRIKVKKLHENAVMPSKVYESDFCYDVVATTREEIAPNVWKYGLGLAFQIDRQYNRDNDRHINSFLRYYNLRMSIDFRPRSSVWKTGLVLSNCTGTIDENYTGEVSAIFYKVAEGKIYDVGDRIGQIKLNFTPELKFVEVDRLDSTDRGSGGYGSTGK